MASVTEGLNFSFYLILIHFDAKSYIGLMATILNSMALKPSGAKEGSITGPGELFFAQKRLNRPERPEITWTRCGFEAK